MNVDIVKQLIKSLPPVQKSAVLNWIESDPKYNSPDELSNAVDQLHITDKEVRERIKWMVN